MQILADLLAISSVAAGQASDALGGSTPLPGYLDYYLVPGIEKAVQMIRDIQAAGRDRNLNAILESTSTDIQGPSSFVSPHSGFPLSPDWYMNNATPKEKEALKDFDVIQDLLR